MLEYNSFTQCQHPVDFVWPNTVDQTDIQPRAKKRLEAIAQRYVDNAREREFERIVQDYAQSVASTTTTSLFPSTNEINIEVSARAAAHTLALAMGSRQDSAVQITALSWRSTASKSPILRLALSPHGDFLVRVDSFALSALKRCAGPS
jgi:hypothetical protein